ncbi:MAG: hypothetical protein M3N13_00350 [Candidatus Eremiobacteraeota bacterium]|nr:hypothetical protein [Candidatus Eremiobacteraeota bacterium]
MNKGSFLDALSNEWISPRQLGLDSRQVEYLFAYLIGSDVGARCMLTECHYVDADYLEDFAAFYVSSFPPYERFCRRLHFFSEVFSSEEMDAILSGDHGGVGRLKRSYLGFVVARPLPEAVIGRTVLRRKRVDVGSHRYFPATRMYSPNLFGIEMSLPSLAFEEQDTAVAACATVALWSAFHKTYELFDSALPRPAAITRAANNSFSSGRAFPSGGLDGNQIAEAIRWNRLEPEVYGIIANTPFVSLVYAYVRAEIPVILSVYIEGDNGGYHAVTVVGYSYGDNIISNPEPPFEGVQSRPGRRIDRLIVHDDNVGPFAELKVEPISTIVEDPLPEDVDPPVALRYPSGSDTLALVSSEQSEHVAPESVAARIPFGIHVPACSEMRVTYVVMIGWLARLMDFFRYYRAGFAEFGINVDRIEWDLRLSRINDFKNGLRQSHWANPEARKLVTESLPRFLWLATMYVGEEPIVDLIADVTDTVRSCPFLRTMWHHDVFKTFFQNLLDVKSVKELWRLPLRPRFYDFLQTGKADHLREKEADELEPSD